MYNHKVVINFYLSSLRGSVIHPKTGISFFQQRSADILLGIFQSVMRKLWQYLPVLKKWMTQNRLTYTALLYNKDGINDFPFSSGYNAASQPDRSV